MQPPALSLGAGDVLTNQANSTQTKSIGSLLGRQVDWLKAEHDALVKEPEDLRIEMR